MLLLFGWCLCFVWLFWFDFDTVLCLVNYCLDSGCCLFIDCWFCTSGMFLIGRVCLVDVGWLQGAVFLFVYFYLRCLYRTCKVLLLLLDFVCCLLFALARFVVVFLLLWFSYDDWFLHWVRMICLRLGVWVLIFGFWFLF